MTSLLRICLFLAILCSFTRVTAHDFEVDGIYYNINGNEATVTYQGTSYSSKITTQVIYQSHPLSRGAVRPILSQA